MNELETHLRSWAPRRPSPKLKARLFGRKASAEETSPTSFRLSWLAPSGAAIAMICLFFNLRIDPIAHPDDAAKPLVAMISSNRSLGSSLLGPAPASARFIKDTFEFNDAGATSVNNVPRALIATNL